MGSPLVNLGIYAAVCVGALAVPIAVRAALCRCWRTCRHVAAEPAYPPIERIAADLRRLATTAHNLPAGSTYVRHRALEMAYDDVLVMACRALQIPHELGELKPGWERDIERLRVEACLIGAGLPIRAEQHPRPS